MILEMMQYYLKISINKICLLIPEFILKYVSEIKNWFADYFFTSWQADQAHAAREERTEKFLP
ncbi:hypothetical protein [Methanosarcina horonobensis]|uniref:hypothetical protein n=1 Tax=Methanosarcina horonobensis TaxID=418008 RepID=UPI0022B8F4BE|nr:hypothetical protein [Methanosarcina horonobensis]